MADQRADFDVPVVRGYFIETAHAVDVDEQGGMAQSHIESGDQALSAGEEACVVVRQQFDRVRDRASLGIGKRCRLQSFLPAAFWALWPLGAGRQSLPADARLVKRALPSPVPIVSAPQCFTSLMNGVSLSPCTTASLCNSTAVSCSPILGMALCRLSGKLKRLLSQLPGRFWAPRSMVPSESMMPGQPMPMNGARRSPSLPARVISPLSIPTSSSTASSRVSFFSSPCRHSSNFQTAALERSEAFFRLRRPRQPGYWCRRCRR